MSAMAKKTIEIPEGLHGRLQEYGNLGETFADAIERALDESEGAAR